MFLSIEEGVRDLPGFMIARLYPRSPSAIFAAALLASAVCPVARGGECVPEIEWVETYDLASKTGDNGRAVAIDSAGNVIAAGMAGQNAAADWHIRKYTASGALVWTRDYDGTFADIVGYKMAVDSADNVIVAGWEWQGALGQNWNWRIRKYSSAGGLLWSVDHDGGANWVDQCGGVAVDSAGGVFAVGHVNLSGAGGDQTWRVRKYTAGGSFVWQRNYDSPANDVDWAYDVAVDAAGNAIVVGAEKRSDLGQGYNWMIRKYTPAGSDVWNRTYSGPGGGDDEALAVAVDSGGNAVVAGRTDRSDLAQGMDWMVRKYAPNGSLLWSRTYNSPNNAEDVALGVAVDGDDGIIVAGMENRSDLGQGDDWRVRKYSANGDLLWSLSYDSPAGGADVASDVAAYADGKLVVIGSEDRFDLAQGDNWRITKFSCPARLTCSLSLPDREACLGESVPVVLTVSNTGHEDCLTALARPYILAGSGSANMAGGPAPPMPVTLPAGGCSGFTWNYSGDGLGTVIFSTTVTGTDARSGNPVSSGTVSSAALSVGAPAVLAALAATTGRASVGQWIPVTLTVTNTGGVSAEGVVAAVAARPGSGTFVNGPFPAGPMLLAAGASRTFSWTYSVTGAGLHVFTATASGTTCVAAPISVSARASSTATLPAALTGEVNVSPTVYTIGQVITVTMTVTNTGQAAAELVIPSLIASPAIVIRLTGPVPPLAGTLSAGAGATFTWTYLAQGAGTLAFSGGASGNDENSGLATATGNLNSPPVDILAPAALSANLVMVPNPVNVGQGFLLLFTITNSGGASVSGFSVAPVLASGGGTANQTAGPAPPIPASLAGGMVMTFTWTYAGAVPGTVWYSTTASGTDTVLGGAVSAGVVVSNAGMIQVPSALAGSSAGVIPEPACIGGQVEVVITVTNTGEASASAVAPAGSMRVEPIASAALVSSPTGTPFLAGGVSTNLTWVFDIDSSGPLRFSVTVMGTDANTGGTVRTGGLSSGDVASFQPPVLEVAASAPAVAVIGQWVDVSVTVTNTGGQTALGVTPAAGATPGPVQVVTGPAPPGPVDIASGASQTFVWTYSVSGAGAVVFSLSVTGESCGGVPVRDSAGVGMQAQAPASIVIENVTLAPSAVGFGVTVSGSAVARNPGGTALTLNVLTVVLASGTAGAVSAPSVPNPALPLVLAPGASQAFSWSHVTDGACATAYVAASASGTEAVTGASLLAGPVSSNLLQVVGPPFGLTLAASVSQAYGNEPVQLTARLTDACGLGVAGMLIAFSAAAPGDSLSAPSAVTDSGGRARVELRPGLDAGVRTLRAELAAPEFGAETEVTVLVNPLALTDPGVALSANVIEPRKGDVVLARIKPVNARPVWVKIYTASGRLVRRMSDLVPIGDGQWLATWDGKTADGVPVARGVYLIRVIGGGVNEVLKVIVK